MLESFSSKSHKKVMKSRYAIRKSSGRVSRRYLTAYRRAQNAKQFRAFSSRVSAVTTVIVHFFILISGALASFADVVLQTTVVIGKKIGNSTEGLITKTKSLPVFQRMSYSSRHKRVTIALGFAGVSIAIFSLVFYRVGLEVTFKGESIGFVSTQSEFLDAVESASARVSTIINKPFVFRPDVRYNFKLVQKAMIFNKTEAENSIIQLIDVVKPLFVLSVNGAEIAACEKSSDIQSVMDNILAEYPLQSDFDSVEFNEDIQITYKMYDASLEISKTELAELLTQEVSPETYVNVAEDDTIETIAQNNGISADALISLNPLVKDVSTVEKVRVRNSVPFLSIAKTQRVTYTEVIPFETETVPDSSLFEDEKEVVTEGKNGIAYLTANIKYVDEKVVSTDVLSSVVLEQSVTEVANIGTKARKTTGSYVHPFAKGKISSNYGKRNFTGSWETHAGIDFAGPYGSEIVAADGGEVIIADYKGTLGNVVFIQHSKNLVTIYGHCSKLLVKPGQIVGKGEVIALVGSTGRSTGNHLHFEVRINGTSVNPLPYANNTVSKNSADK